MSLICDIHSTRVDVIADNHQSVQYLNTLGLPAIILLCIYMFTMSSCRCGDVECVRYLVEDVSCDTSCANKHGEIPLHCASKYVIQHLFVVHVKSKFCNLGITYFRGVL